MVGVPLCRAGQSAGQGDQVLVGRRCGRVGPISASTSRRGSVRVAGESPHQGRGSTRAPRARRSAARSRAAARSAAGVRPVAGAAVEPAAAARRLDRLTTTGRHGQRAQPAARQAISASTATASSSSAGRSQSGSSVVRADAVAGDEVVQARDVPDQAVAAAQQPQRDGGVVGAQDLVVRQRVAGAEQHHAGRAPASRPPKQLPSTGYSTARSTRTSSPSYAGSAQSAAAPRSCSPRTAPRPRPGLGSCPARARRAPAVPRRCARAGRWIVLRPEQLGRRDDDRGAAVHPACGRGRRRRGRP